MSLKAGAHNSSNYRYCSTMEFHVAGGRSTRQLKSWSSTKQPRQLLSCQRNKWKQLQANPSYWPEFWIRNSWGTFLLSIQIRLLFKLLSFIQNVREPNTELQSKDFTTESGRFEFNLNSIISFLARFRVPFDRPRIEILLYFPSLASEFFWHPVKISRVTEEDGYDGW